MSPSVEWKFTVPKVKNLADPFQNLDDCDAPAVVDEKAEIERSRLVKQYVSYCPPSSHPWTHLPKIHPWIRYLPHTCRWSLEEKAADLDSALQHAMNVYDDFDMIYEDIHETGMPEEYYLAELCAYDALQNGKGRSFAAEYMFETLVAVVYAHFDKMKWWNFRTRGK